MITRKKTPLHHKFEIYNKNKFRCSKLKKAPKLTDVEEREKIDQFLSSGRAKRYLKNASYLLDKDGDLPSQKLLEKWEYIKE